VAVAGDVVFVGHGIVAPEYKWNDYDGADIKGRIALIMVNDPPATPSEPGLFAGDALTYYGRWTYKFEEAARQGAAGAILIHTPASATYPWQVVQSSWSGPQFALPNEPGQPVLEMKAWVTEDAARRIAKEGGKDLDALRQAAVARGFRAVPLGVKVSGSIRQQTDRRESPNVVGLLRGTNDSQGIVYTAHYDHLGMREPSPESAASDTIYNGALDNATGVAGILEIAQSFIRARAKPARSIYFLATTAEEAGLLGAAYFARHPPLPIDRFVANINVDGLNIVGPSRDIVLLGAERSTLGKLADAIAKGHNRYVGPDPEPGRGYFFRSDHFPLAQAGVPAVSISDPAEYVGKDPAFAKKMRDEYNEKHYHQPSDEFDTAWNLEGAVDDLRLLAELGWPVSETAQIPAYDPADQFARPRLQR
jgi:Zn-dependent M28 family amino/carboxypeptidase